jgi:hypothetical protein
LQRFNFPVVDDEGGWQGADGQSMVVGREPMGWGKQHHHTSWGYYQGDDTNTAGCTNMTGDTLWVKDTSKLIKGQWQGTESVGLNISINLEGDTVTITAL